MSETWNKAAKEWDSNADVIAYSEEAYHTLCQWLNIEGLTILDFGCGTGLLAEKMAQKAKRILALDTSEGMITVLKNKRLKNVDTLVAELSEATIMANDLLKLEFDLIVASSVCAFLENYESTLLLFKKLLKPNGIFIQWDWLKQEADSTFGFSKAMIESAFNKANLEIVSISQVFSLANKTGTMPVLMGVAKNSHTFLHR